MIEIRFHGRGGQGAVVASNVLAIACFSEEKQVQSFSSFGVERRGASVETYTQIDRRTIFLWTNVHTPDHVVVLDPALIGDGAVTRGLKPGGTLVLNTDKPPHVIEGFGPFSVCTVDASRIALRHHLGASNSPIVNAAIFGAFARATELFRSTRFARLSGKKCPPIAKRPVIGEVSTRRSPSVPSSDIWPTTPGG